MLQTTQLGRTLFTYPEGSVIKSRNITTLRYTNYNNWFKPPSIGLHRRCMSSAASRWLGVIHALEMVRATISILICNHRTISSNAGILLKNLLMSLIIPAIDGGKMLSQASRWSRADIIIVIVQNLPGFQESHDVACKLFQLYIFRLESFFCLLLPNVR